MYYSEVIEKFNNIFKANNGKEIYNYLNDFYTSFNESKSKIEDFKYIHTHLNDISVEKITNLKENVQYVCEEETVKYIIRNFIGNRKDVNRIDMFNFAVVDTCLILENIKEPTGYSHITVEEILEVFEYPNIKDILPHLNSFSILKINGTNNDIMSTYIPQNNTIMLYSPSTNDRNVIKHDFIYQLGNVLAHSITNNYYGVPKTFVHTFEDALSLKRDTLKSEDAISVFCDCFIMSMLQNSPMYEFEPLHNKMKQSSIDMILNYFNNISKY